MQFFFHRRHLFYVCLFLCLMGFICFLGSCTTPKFLQKKEPSVKRSEPVQARDFALELTPASATVGWNETATIETYISWETKQSYPVRISVVDCPSWLTVTPQPAILEPDQTGKLSISPMIGEAKLGPTEILLQASSYGMKRPREFRFTVDVTRQSGSFAKILLAPVTQQCRLCCAQLTTSGNQPVVNFYNLYPDLGQECGDKKSLPMSQRINGRPYPIGDEGYGFGRTCRVALVASPSGDYSLVNIALPGASVPPGNVLLQLRNVQGFWLSPDNTIALVLSSNSLKPYDVMTGQLLGETCHIVGQLTHITLEDGINLTAQADYPCRWTIE
ncbi:hypothetical protein KKG05_08115 [bacterium]|nr:hypothetical protein [bacterium]